MKSNQTYQHNDIYDKEINFLELVRVLWNGKITLLTCIVLFSVLAVFYALTQPNIYRSEVLLSPASQSQSNNYSGLGGQLGGLASLAGVNLGGGEVSKVKFAIEVLQSRVFITKFIDKYSLLPDLMAAKSWDITTGEISYDAELYNTQEKKWIREASFPSKAKPSEQEAYKEFRENLSINNSPDTGMVTIAFEHISPMLAQKLVSLLVLEINNSMRERDVIESKKYSEYLRQEIEINKLASMQSILNNLLEEQAKAIMLASVREEYVFKVIDPALAPEKKVGPKRVFICLLGFLAGLFLGVIIVFLREHFLNQQVKS